MSRKSILNNSPKSRKGILRYKSRNEYFTRLQKAIDFENGVCIVLSPEEIETLLETLPAGR